MKSKEDVMKAISEVQHPAIAFSLLDLGIVKDIEVNDDVVNVTFAFPFPNIPIAGQLIHSISGPVESLGYVLKHSIVVMTEEERAKFMSMEARGWRG